jgi:hypothetical protein
MMVSCLVQMKDHSDDGRPRNTPVHSVQRSRDNQFISHSTPSILAVSDDESHDPSCWELHSLAESTNMGGHQSQAVGEKVGRPKNTDSTTLQHTSADINNRKVGTAKVRRLQASTQTRFSIKYTASGPRVRSNYGTQPRSLYSLLIFVHDLQSAVTSIIEQGSLRIAGELQRSHCTMLPTTLPHQISELCSNSSSDQGL